MTPEEKAVVDAAIEWWNAGRELDNVKLGISIDALLNTRRTAEQGVPDEMVWVERTWRDVRAGDTVRQPGTSAVADVDSSQLQSWHVNPGWVTDKNLEYHPEPLEHEVMCVYLLPLGQEDPKRYDMNPAAAVEILLSTYDAKMADMFGWDGRVATTITEEQP